MPKPRNAILEGCTENVVPLRVAEPRPVCEDLRQGQARGEPHTVAYRASVPLLGRRYYLAFFVGYEQRSPWRVQKDGQRRSWLHVVLGVSAALMFASALLMSTLATGYLLKSLLGIDLFDGHFFLHSLFFVQAG